MNYIKEAIKTDLADYQPVIQRIDTRAARLLHGTIGISTEAGELLDAIKKHLMYGKQLDIVNIKEEISDLFWYCAIICDELNVSFEEIQQKNIEKLRARYGEKFSEDKAINRDIKTERTILEK